MGVEDPPSVGARRDMIINCFYWLCTAGVVASIGMGLTLMNTTQWLPYQDDTNAWQWVSIFHATCHDAVADDCGAKLNTFKAFFYIGWGLLFVILASKMACNWRPSTYHTVVTTCILLSAASSIVTWVCLYAVNYQLSVHKDISDSSSPEYKCGSVTSGQAVTFLIADFALRLLVLATWNGAFLLQKIPAGENPFSKGNRREHLKTLTLGTVPVNVPRFIDKPMSVS